jgi:cell wall-associated NlpC family hydrolase
MPQSRNRFSLSGPSRALDPPVFDRPEGKQVSELLAGESFMLLDVSGGWGWGFCKHDHYVGYLRADALTAEIQPISEPLPPDLLAAARYFLDMPYVWGGRGGAGIDCSGLIQRSLAAIGIAAPRDSDMQMEALGVVLPDNEPLQARDLVFFPGHVGMMVDPANLIHATMHFGRTLIEPLADVIGRSDEDHASGALVCRRIVS